MPEPLRVEGALAGGDVHICPKCGEECWREDVHNGVCVIYGPWGCPACGWSEEERFDVAAGPRYEGRYRLDQFGGATPVRPGPEAIAAASSCSYCAEIAARGGFGPSHNGSRLCESGSIASGGKRSHCTCDVCF